MGGVCVRKYKNTVGGYIISVGSGVGGEEITEAEYSNLLSIIHAAPHKDGYGYRLKTDLTWEEYELPPVETEPLTDEEALTRYANELTGADDPDLVSATETLINQRMEDK